MGRTTTLLDGAIIQDIATSEAHDVDAGTYNYYGYLKAEGSWVILREKDDETQYRYTVGGSGYAAAWAARSSKTYVTVDNFPNIV